MLARHPRQGLSLHAIGIPLSNQEIRVSLPLIHTGNKNVNLLPVFDSLSTQIFPRWCLDEPLGNRHPKTHSEVSWSTRTKSSKSLDGVLLRCLAPNPLRSLPRCSDGGKRNLRRSSHRQGRHANVPKNAALPAMYASPLGVCFKALSQAVPCLLHLFDNRTGCWIDGSMLASSLTPLR